MRKEKGITLVALIITIIVLLILAMVSISLVINSGILSKTKYAVDKYNDEENDEQDKLLKLEYEMAKYSGNYSGSYDGYVLEKKYGLKIGDYVNYETVLPEVTLTEESQIIKDLRDYSGNTDNTADKIKQQTNLKWRVLDIKDGKIRLISETPTSFEIKLLGADGYNNAVYLIDEVCKELYSSDKGTAQNLKIEDIQKFLTYDYSNYVNNYSVQYGKAKQYTSSTNYPKIFRSEISCKIIDDDNIVGTLEASTQENNQLVNGTESAKLEAKQTDCRKQMSSEDFTDSMYYTLFINKGNSNYSEYWLSSRTINCGLFYPYYNISEIHNGSVTSRCLYDTSHNSNNGNYKLRPIVTLSSDAQIQKDETHDGSSQEKACLIK